MNVQKDVDEESPELARFRKEWKEEVRQRTAEPTRGQPSSPPENETLTTPTALTDDAPSTNRPTVQPPAVPSGSARDSTTTPGHIFQGETQLGRSLARAVEIYRSAVRHEQDGLLDDALRLYRQAFRLDPNVDRAYFSEEQRLQRLLTTAQPGDDASRSTHQKTTSVEKGGVKLSTVTPQDHHHPASGILANLVADFPSNVTFTSDDERKSATLGLIPDELLLRILRSLDTTTIERFATACRKARVLSLDSLIWR